MKPNCHYGSQVVRLARLLHTTGPIFDGVQRRRFVRDVLKAGKTPTDTTHREIVSILTRWLGERLAALTDQPVEQAKLLAALRKFDWIELAHDGKDARIRSEVLLEYAPDRIDVQASGDESAIHLVLEFKAPLRKFAPREFCRNVQPSELARQLREFVLKRLRAGCTELLVATNMDSAGAILALFLEGELDRFEIEAAYVEQSSEPRWVDGPSVRLDLRTPAATAELERRWRLAVRRQAIVAAIAEAEASADLLATLAMPGHKGDALTRQTLRASAHNFLAAPSLAFRQLMREAAWGFGQWPMVALLLLGIGASLLHIFGLSAAIGFGVASGLGLAFFGSLNCALSTSPLAGAAGAVGIATTFGLAHMLVASACGGTAALARSTIQSDPFVRIVGGIIGLQPGVLRAVPWPVSALVLALTAIAIIWSGWVMTRPNGATPAVRLQTLRPNFGAGIGALAGLGIGLTYGATAIGRMLGSAEWGFTLGFAISGGGATLITIWLATGHWRRASGFGVGHALVSVASLPLIFAVRGTWLGLVAGASATGYFHATFFMTALMTGWSIGGKRAGVLAAGIEGAGGYLGFVLVRTFFT